MINGELKELLNEKIQQCEFDVVDIPSYFTFFCELGNEVEDLQEEVEGWNRRLQFVLDGLGIYWMTVEDGRFTTGEGILEDPDLVLNMSAVDAAQIFAGDKEATAAYMSGALKVEGDLPDAAKMLTLIETVIEEIEY